MENKKNIQDELKEVAPTLAGLQNIIPFKVPENYFEELERAALVGAGLKKEISINEIAGERDYPFSLPKDYFENLPLQILDKVKHQNTADFERGRIRKIRQRWWMAAASIILIIACSLLFRHNSQTSLASTNQIDTSYLLLENAASLADADVFNLYTENETETDDSSMNQYLIEVTSIDPETINTL